jgi:hypothetical protein
MHPQGNRCPCGDAATTEMTRELIRSLIDQFLGELPPLYGKRWLLAWQNNAAYC